MKKSEVKTFESNPLKVIVRGLDRLFSSNLAWGVILLIIGLASTPSMFNNSEQTTQSSDILSDPAFDFSNTAPLILLAFSVLIIVIVVSAFLEGILSYVAYKASRDEKAGFAETLSVVYAKFPTLFATWLLVIFRIIGGLILFIIPGIRAILRYQFVFFPIFEKDVSAKHAIEQSKKLTSGHLMEIFGFSIFSSIVPVLGQALQVGALAEYYQQLKSLKARKKTAPKTHWLNYTPIILIILFIVFAIAAGVQDAGEIKQPHNINYGVESA